MSDVPSIELRGKEIEYDVRRSSEASKSRIDVDTSGVTVTIPEGRDLDPDAFLTERQDWVLDKYEEVESFLAKVPDRSFAPGEAIPFLGEDHELTAADVDAPTIDDGRILVPSDLDAGTPIKKAIEELLREEARERIQGILDKYEEEVDGDYDKVYIRNQKTKWASCSPKQNLSFNWRLVMAPEEILEYVVVHELVHLEEPDHSDRFWRRVGEIVPDYQKRQEQLHEKHPVLILSEGDF